MEYNPLLKTSNNILKFLSFDWLTGNGLQAHIYQHVLEASGTELSSREYRPK